MNWAVIKDGVVINVVRWDGNTPWTKPEGTQLVNIDGVMAGIGWTYSNHVFTPPDKPPSRR